MRKQRMKIKCPECEQANAVKNGFVAGNQRYKCTNCGRQFVLSARQAKGDAEKRLAVMLYASGLSMRVIGKIIDVSVQTVSRWIREFYTARIDEVPKMGPMYKVTKLQILDFYRALAERELKEEVFILSAKLASGKDIRILIENPVRRKEKIKRPDGV